MDWVDELSGWMTTTTTFFFVSRPFLKPSLSNGQGLMDPAMQGLMDPAI